MLFFLVFKFALFSASAFLYVLGFLFVDIQLLVLVKRIFFGASIFATVSGSTLLVRSRRSSVSAKSAKKTVDSVRRNINKLNPNYLLIPKSNSGQRLSSPRFKSKPYDSAVLKMSQDKVTQHDVNL